jgi:hypothetical protein
MNNYKDYTVHIQIEKYWFAVLRGPSLAFKRLKSSKIGKLSLKEVYEGLLMTPNQFLIKCICVDLVVMNSVGCSLC